LLVNGISWLFQRQNEAYRCPGFLSALATIPTNTVILFAAYPAGCVVTMDWIAKSTITVADCGERESPSILFCQREKPGKQHAGSFPITKLIEETGYKRRLPGLQALQNKISGRPFS